MGSSPTSGFTDAAGNGGFRSPRLARPGLCGKQMASSAATTRSDTGPPTGQSGEGRRGCTSADPFSEERTRRRHTQGRRPSVRAFSHCTRRARGRRSSCAETVSGRCRTTQSAPLPECTRPECAIYASPVLVYRVHDTTGDDLDPARGDERGAGRHRPSHGRARGACHSEGRDACRQPVRALLEVAVAPTPLTSDDGIA